MSLSGKDVAEIARLLDASRFSDLELEMGEFRLKIRRGGSRGSSRREPAPAKPVTARAPKPIKPSAAPKAGETDIPAPLLGTFYHAPRPGDPPFVAPGQTIAADSVIGIIEVMKLMNPVHAGLAGEIVAVLADNATSVEAGQPLVRVRTG